MCRRLVNCWTAALPTQETEKIQMQKAHLYEAILLVDRKMDEEFARTGTTQERLGLRLEPGVQVRFLSGEEKRGWEREYAKSGGT